MILGARLSDGSKRNYKYGTNIWIKFCKSFGISPYIKSRAVIKYFALYRFLLDTCKSQTIKGNFSAINDFRIKSGYRPIAWKEVCWELPYIYQVIDKVLPPGKGSLPNDEKFTLRFKKYYNLNKMSHHTLWMSNVWAYSFALRSCEYSMTKDYDPPVLDNLKFHKTPSGQDSYLYIIPKSKKNQTGTKREVLQTVCVCPSLCAFCEMMSYMTHRHAINHKVKPRYRKYLFLYKKKISSGVYEFRPLTATVVRINFDFIVKRELGSDHGHTVHGWRAGGITDLIRLGLSREIVTAISRHSPQSAVFDRYIRFTHDHIARLVQDAKSVKFPL